MKLRTLTTAAITTITLTTTVAAAAAGGIASSDRFGYEGTITRYGSLIDAQSGTNSIETLNIMDRDLSLYMANNDSVESDFNYMSGSWWYTTHETGTAGWGNTTGNTGPGFMQLYDDDASTDTSVSMEFNNFDGTHYTQFDMSVEGAGADAADYARLSAYDNLNDGGIWHSYSLNMSVFGLEGVMTAPGVIESTNEATGVSGTITAIFEITENQTNGDSIGFYAVDFTLTMDNWAFDNRDDLTGDYAFDPSFFRTVPTPGAFGTFAITGFFASRRRR